MVGDFLAEDIFQANGKNVYCDLINRRLYNEEKGTKDQAWLQYMQSGSRLPMGQRPGNYGEYPPFRRVAAWPGTGKKPHY